MNWKSCVAKSVLLLVPIAIVLALTISWHAALVFLVRAILLLLTLFVLGGLVKLIWAHGHPEEK